MHFILSLFGFIFLLLTLGMAAIVWKVRRRMKQIRDAMQDNLKDEAFQRMADKNYNKKHANDGPVFDEDYFKGDPNSWRNKAQQQNEPRWKKTQTSDGVTIYDDVDRSKAKKIFEKDEGEYVDFREE